MREIRAKGVERRSNGNVLKIYLSGPFWLHLEPGKGVTHVQLKSISNALFYCVQIS